MVVEVRHDYLVLLIEGDAARAVELLPQRAVEAVLVEELTVRVEQLDAVVASVRDEDVRLARHCYVPWVVEVRAWFAAFFAEFEQKCAVWLEYLLKEFNRGYFFKDIFTLYNRPRFLIMQLFLFYFKFFSIRFSSLLGFITFYKVVVKL